MDTDWTTISGNLSTPENGSANTSSPLGDTKDYMMSETWLRAILITLYCIIFVLGNTGNCLVVFVVIRNKSMQTITNIFITNLAISDIMMCLLAVPFTPLSGLLQDWVFGEALCHIVPMALGVSVHVSTLTSTAIAIDRYFVIVHPFKPRMKVIMCLLLIKAIWIISISISLPLAIYQQVSWDEKEDAFLCHEEWPKATARQFFTVISLILQYIVPCSIISFCYTKVSMKLHTRARARIGTGTRTADRDELEMRRKRRTNKMLIAMVAIFVCCWLPLNLVHLTIEYNSELQHGKYFLLVFFIAHVIAMSSTIYNPFLYAWMNENFKKEFKQVIPCLFSRGGSRQLNGNASQYTTVDTQHTLVNRSPPKERNGCSNETKALYDKEQGKVKLTMQNADTWEMWNNCLCIKRGDWYTYYGFSF